MVKMNGPLPVSAGLRRIRNNPPRAHDLDAPSLVRLLREASRVVTVYRLQGGERATGLEAAVIQLKAAAVRKGVIWDSDEEHILQRARNNDEP